MPYNALHGPTATKIGAFVRVIMIVTSKLLVFETNVFQGNPGQKSRQDQNETKNECVFFGMIAMELAAEKDVNVVIDSAIAKFVFLLAVPTLDQESSKVAAEVSEYTTIIVLIQTGDQS